MKAVTINRWLEDVVVEHGPRTALSFLRNGQTETELTYAQLRHDVNQFAATLLDLGVQAGDRVILFIPKSIIAVVAHFALLSLGPTLKVMGEGQFTEYDLTLPLPYAFLTALPGLGSWRTPGRFILVSYVGLAVAASFGLAWRAGA